MKRRSKAGGEPIKGRRRKTPEPKRRNVAKAIARSNSSPTQEETQVARLTRELNDALERLTSTSEVLAVISRSNFELQPLLQTVAVNAARLCRADGAAIFRLENGAYRFAAGYSLNQVAHLIRRCYCRSFGPTRSATGRSRVCPIGTRGSSMASG